MYGDMLRLLRITAMYAQQDMAKKLGISSSYLSEIETGRKDPPVRLLAIYAKVFDVSQSSMIKLAERLESEGKKVREELREVIRLFVENKIRR